MSRRSRPFDWGLKAMGSPSCVALPFLGEADADQPSAGGTSAYAQTVIDGDGGKFYARQTRILTMVRL